MAVVVLPACRAPQITAPAHFGSKSATQSRAVGFFMEMSRSDHRAGMCDQAIRSLSERFLHHFADFHSVGGGPTFDRSVNVDDSCITTH